MKIIKSGIELDPSELDQAFGGMCACGCPIGMSGTNLAVGGTENNGCYCSCTCSIELLHSDFINEYRNIYSYIYPPL